VIRLDGKGFTKMTARYNFKKPNDDRALYLMNEATANVVKELQDIIISYGQSDEVRYLIYVNSFTSSLI
jgi:tRNA(His) 5'-end guanylyltransferase